MYWNEEDRKYLWHSRAARTWHVGDGLGDERAVYNQAASELVDVSGVGAKPAERTVGGRCSFVAREFLARRVFGFQMS